ncbi:MAG: hypothetical protein LDL18_05410 [Zymomonas sp.]|nr:hypothetical protein [Zymomonas sp.]
MHNNPEPRAWTDAWLSSPETTANIRQALPKYPIELDSKRYSIAFSS